MPVERWLLLQAAAGLSKKKLCQLRSRAVLPLHGQLGFEFGY